MTVILTNFRQRTFTRGGTTVSALPLEFRILTALLSARGPLTWSELVEGIYGDRRDGGPDYAHGSINVMISRMRYGYWSKKRWFHHPILPPLGVEIKATSLGYRIAIMDMPQMREAA